MYRRECLLHHTFSNSFELFIFYSFSKITEEKLNYTVLIFIFVCLQSRESLQMYIVINLSSFLNFFFMSFAYFHLKFLMLLLILSASNYGVR